MESGGGKKKMYQRRRGEYSKARITGGKKDDRRWDNYTRRGERNYTRVTSVLIMDWKTVLLPSSAPPGLSPVGWYSHVES